MSSTTRKPTSRLGRGLSALIPDAPAPMPGEALRTVPVEALEPGPFQPRGGMDRASLEELATSIREHGILQPILVRPKPGSLKPGSPGSYEIIGGERRWRAAQAAQLHDVPVVVRDMSDREAMAAGLVENLQRQDLNALEEAEGYKRLVEEFGLTQETLGQSVGKSRSHVANTLRLLGLPQTVRDLVRNGILSAGHARALLGTPDPAKLANQVVVRGLNVRQTEALVAARPREPNRAAKPEDRETRALERDLTEKLGLQVAIRHQGKSGEVSIRYKDLDQLDGLIRLLQGGG